jgi:NAD(P)-dependent dehydrogenase (short-subunit alcohol dehydrogenase family)
MSAEASGRRVAVVTGAATGLGQAYARRLAADGAVVCLADVADTAETRRSIADAGGDAWAAPCDVTSEDSVAGFMGGLLDRYGRCDILVNNAGIYPMLSFEDTSLSDLRRINAVSLEGTFLLSQAALPAMKDRGWGRIVNIATTTAWLVVPGFSAYIASKMAVIGLTRAMATELGEYGITVNCACPSLVRTVTTAAGPQAAWFEDIASRQAIKQVQEPDDMVGLVSFLCSDDARFVTGQTVLADGGLVRL